MLEPPANTLGYFIAGYAVIFGMIGFYVISLVVRWRNAQQDLQVLTELDKDGKMQ